MTYRYQAFYCEENAWWLCQRSELGPGKREVWFISNESKQCALLEQRAAPVGLEVIWDYHVVVVVGDAVWDLDSRLGMPVPVLEYLEKTFPDLPAELRHLAPRFRVVDADELVATLHSDRSHMRTPDGGWLRPPPAWDPPRAAFPPNLMRFVDLDDDEIAGEVLDLDALVARYSR